MSTSIAYCILICFAAIIVVLSIGAPNVLADSNSFLSSFVGAELLNILGVIVAITLASAAQMHLALNGIEERFNRRNSFVATRAGIRAGSYTLIILFAAAFLLVVAKPHVATTAWSQSLVNGAAIFIVLWNVLVLVALTQGVFALGPTLKDEGGPHEG
ncbi:hypothetical protein [Microvirga sp. TS319]|uniref:hypothetical protein n=1 Tax=Microvirga sp. TS319 TaxID=3241165 RepID=UPI00351A1A3D